MIEQQSITSEKFPIPEECPTPKEYPTPEECPTEWHAGPNEPDTAAADQADPKDSLAKILLPDVALYHD